MRNFTRKDYRLILDLEVKVEKDIYNFIIIKCLLNFLKDFSEKFNIEDISICLNKDKLNINKNLYLNKIQKQAEDILFKCDKETKIILIHVIFWRDSDDDIAEIFYSKK